MQDPGRRIDDIGDDIPTMRDVDRAEVTELRHEAVRAHRPIEPRPDVIRARPVMGIDDDDFGYRFIERHDGAGRPEPQEVPRISCALAPSARLTGFGRGKPRIQQRRHEFPR